MKFTHTASITAELLPPQKGRNESRSVQPMIRNQTYPIVVVRMESDTWLVSLSPWTRVVEMYSQMDDVELSSAPFFSRWRMRLFCFN